MKDSARCRRLLLVREAGGSLGFFLRLYVRPFIALAVVLVGGIALCFTGLAVAGWILAGMGFGALLRDFASLYAVARDWTLTERILNWRLVGEIAGEDGYGS